MNRKQRSRYWDILMSSLLPGVCSILIILISCVPAIISAARKNDEAYANQLLYTASSCINQLEKTSEQTILRLENSTEMKHILMQHVFLGKQISAGDKESVINDLSVWQSQSAYLDVVSFRFYGFEHELYSSKGFFEDVAFMQNISPDKIQYHFFSEKQMGFHTITFRGTEYLIYYAEIPGFQGGRSMGEINLVFKTAAVRNMLTEAVGGNNMNIAIANPEGEICWKYVGLANNKEKVLEISGTPVRSNHRCILEMTPSVYNQTAKKIIPILSLAILGGLGVCIVIALWLARKSFRPLDDLVVRYNGRALENENELRFLERIMEQTLTENTHLQDSLDRLKLVAQQKLIGDLLNGTVRLNQKDAFMLTFEKSLFAVVTLRCSFSALQSLYALPDNSQHAAALLMETMLMETMLERMEATRCIQVYLYYEDMDHFRFIVNYDNSDELHGFTTELHHISSQYFQDGTVFVGVGDTVSTTNDIYRSAEHAESACVYAVLSHAEQPMEYAKMNLTNTGAYSYSFTEELLLYKSLLEGNETQAQRVLDNIFETNVHIFDAPIEADRLYGDLYSTICRSAQSIGLSIDFTKRKLRIKDVQTARAELAKMIQRVCDYVLQKNGAEEDQEYVVFKFIDENLFNPALSLDWIAEQTGNSVSYISKLFKKRKSENYSDYVNRKRIAKAVELMVNENRKANEVYLMVGYISISTFRRNYQKYAVDTLADVDDPVDGKQ